jgi:hypothetical protein
LNLHALAGQIVEAKLGTELALELDTSSNGHLDERECIHQAWSFKASCLGRRILSTRVDRIVSTRVDGFTSSDDSSVLPRPPNCRHQGSGTT